MRIECPGCQERFVVTVTSEKAGPKQRPTDSPLTAVAMRAIFNFIVEQGPVRKTNEQLFAAYRTGVQVNGWPRLSQLAFVRGLKEHGAIRWRDSKQRGWELPALVPAIDEPAPPARTTQAQVARRSEGEMIADINARIAAREAEEDARRLLL